MQLYFLLSQVNYQKYHSASIRFAGARVEWLRPASLEELLELKKNYPKAKFVVGNTELGKSKWINKYMTQSQGIFILLVNLV